MALSTKEFTAILREGVSDAAESQGWSMSTNAERGYAFQLWWADLVAAAEESFDTDPQDALLYSQDLGADVVFEDVANRRLVISQCKYINLKRSVEEAEVTAFFNRHEHFSDRNWVRDHGSQAAKDALLDYTDRVSEGWAVEYLFVTTGRASPKVQAIGPRESEKYAKLDINVRCTLLDFGGLKDYFVQAESLEESIPEKVVIKLPADGFIRFNDPYPTIVAVIRGNELRNMYNQFKRSLYAYNIRGFLGSRGINAAIVKTASEEPHHFFFFNNGVTAICTDFQIEDNIVTAYDPQIINGAQTVTALAEADATSELFVLFRLIKGESVKTEKGINEAIIRYNNSQNVVKLSDFRSNDPIQLWLEKNLTTSRAHGALPKLHYVRKRSTKSSGGRGRRVKLEELAKLRYSYLFEPTLIYSAPKNLWTSKDSDGVYEDSFGISGRLESAWPNRVLAETNLALALYFDIDADLRVRARKNPELRYMTRLRYHSLALAGGFVRENYEPKEYESLYSNAKTFDDSFKRVLAASRMVLGQVHSKYVPNDQSMFAFVRSAERWDEMEKQLAEQLALLEEL